MIGSVPVYFSQLGHILVHPTAFFRGLNSNVNPQGAIAFALVTHWIFSVTNYLWQFFTSPVSDSSQALKLISVPLNEKSLWFWKAASVVADPFLTLPIVYFLSWVLFVGARILIGTVRIQGLETERVTIGACQLIVSYSMAPIILASLPGIGAPIAFLYAMIIQTIGVSEIFDTSTGRALAVALFPDLLLCGLFIGSFIVVGAYWAVNLFDLLAFAL